MAQHREFASLGKLIAGELRPHVAKQVTILSVVSPILRFASGVWVCRYSSHSLRLLTSSQFSVPTLLQPSSSRLQFTCVSHVALQCTEAFARIVDGLRARLTRCHSISRFVLLVVSLQLATSL